MNRRQHFFASIITIIYVIMGGLWILFYDKIFAAIFNDPDSLAWMQASKEWLFIVLTAISVFILAKSRIHSTSKKEFEDFFNSAIEGVFRCSPAGQLINTNPAMVHLFDYESTTEMLDDVSKKEFLFFLNGDYHHKFVRTLEEKSLIENFDAQCLRKDGSTFWALIYAHVFREPSGKAKYIEGFVTDITERKTAQAILKQTEARYKAIVEQMPAAVYIDAMDQSSSNVFSSPKIFDITGYSPQEWLEDPDLWFKIIHPEDRPRVLEESERTNKSKEAFEIEYRIITRDGRVAWVRDVASPIMGEAGEWLFWQGILLDITAQRQAEEAIKASEVRYHTLIEDASDAILITDAEGKYLTVNQQACDLLGLHRDELLERSFQDILPPEELAVRPLRLHELSHGRAVVSERALVRKDGTPIPVEMNTKMLPDGSLMSIVRNITERKLSQETLARSEQRFRALIEHSMDAIALFSPDGKILYQSPASLRILGYTLSEMLGRSVLDFIHPDDHGHASSVFEKILQATGESDVIEIRGLHKDGNIRWLEIICTNRTSEPGVNAIVANYRDTTERKQSEEALRAAEARFRILVENIPPVVYVNSVSDQTTFYISPQIYNLLGYTTQEWLADKKSWVQSVYPDDLNQAVEKEKYSRQTGEVFSHEYRMVARDGRVVWVRDQSFLIRDDDGKDLYWQGMLLDITEQKMAESRLQEAESRYRKLVEQLPAVIFMDVINAPELTHYMSPRIYELLGYTSQEWAEGNSIWENSLHPDDKERVLAEDIRTNQTLEPFRIEYRLRTKNDTYKWVREEAFVVCDDDGQPMFWQGILLDISEQKSAQEALQRREKILEAVAFAAEQFLKASNWEDALPHVLERLGKSTQASRVYVFRKHFSEENTLLISQLNEWCDEDIEAQIDNPALQNMDFGGAGYSRWIENFYCGLPVYGVVKDLPEEERIEFTNEGILSIICFPILVEGDWWGFIGFDECRVERVWSPVEVESLRAAVSMLGAAIQRKSTEEALFTGESSYQELFNSVNDAIYIQDVHGDFLDVNEGAVRMYGHPKEFFIGKTLKDLAAPNKNNFEEISRSFQKAVTGDSQRFEFWGTRANGEIFPKEISLYKGVYFGEEGVIAIAQDITERKRVEEWLQRQLKELTVLHSIALAESSARDRDELIQRVTDIIGDTLYTDNCGVLLANKAGDALQPHRSYRGTNLKNLLEVIPATKGITGKTLLTRKAIRIEHVTAAEDYYEVTSDVRSGLSVPIISGDRVHGVINVESKQRSAFTEADERLLNTIAGGMANALERLELFEAEQRQREEAEILRQATASLTSSIDTQKVYQVILDSLSKLVPYTSASIGLLDGETIEIVAQRGLPKDINYVGLRYQFPSSKLDVDFKKPIIIDDVHQDPRFEKMKGTEYIRGWMGLPMNVQDTLLGYLNLDSDKVGFFTEEQGALVQIFANQAATAIANARLFEEERQRTRIIEALAEIANEIATSGDVSSLLDKVCTHAKELLKASHVAVYLLQEDDETIRIVNAKGSFSQELLSHTIKVGEGITGNVIKMGRPEIINDSSKDPRRITVPGTSEEDGKKETIMLSPLIVRGKTIGSINAWRLRADGLFNESELNFLISIAHQTSISLEAARLFQETTRQARESAAIAEVGRDISATLQVDLVFERIAAYAKELLKANTSAVYLIDSSQNMLRAVAALGTDAESIKNFPLKVGSGILGNIAQSKVGEIVNETADDPRAITIEGTDVVRFEHIMGVPVLNKNNLTGLLVVWRVGETQQFGSNELNFLSALALQTAVAIENARLFQAEQRRRQEAENLRTAATAITSSLEPGQVLKTILVALQEVVPYDSAAIFQLEEPFVRITAAKGFPDNDSVINQVFHADNRLLTIINETGKPHILGDSQRSEDFEKWAASDNVHGWMGVPLISRGQVIGYITMDSYTCGAFNENDALLAQTFAHQAAVAIENSRFYIETRRRVEELEVVSRVSVALRVAQDSEKMLSILLHEIKKSMGTDSAGIWLYDPDKDKLIQKVASGGLSAIPHPHLRPGEGIVGRVFVNGKIHISNDFSKDPHTTPENIAVFSEGWGAIAVPIQTTSATIGAIMVAIHPSRKIEQHQINLMKTIAEIAGNAINRLNLFEKSEEQVRRLTTLREIDIAISSTFDLRVTLDILTDYLLSKMGVSATAILTLNPDNQSLVYNSGAGFRSAEFTHTAANSGFANQILMTQKDVHIANLTETPGDSFTWMMAHEGFVSYFGVPLQSKGLIRGVMEMYFRQPFAPNADWQEFVHTLAGQATIAIDNTRLFENLQRSNQELSIAYDTTLEGWGKALELRDKETQGHTRRVTDLTVELARQMGIPESQVTHIRRGALVHDIGKMGVPDSILRKEGPLTDEEWVEMRKHPQYAFDLLYPIPYLRPALEIAYHHHEWWDGSGYPSGLKGNEIPLSARIFAVVDVWDALLSNRPYRKPWSKQQILKYIRGLSGKQFDPEVVEVFLKMMKDKKTGPLPDWKTLPKPK